ncbi:MAG: DUF2752 domain-containing protein [Bacillota bacterium]|nr:DUF2752 domain-containing protein [Bacillota bacterium]
MRRIIKLCLILICAIALFMAFDIGCLIKDIIGIPCAGCGMTRAWISLFHGDILNAFYWHPLFWLAPAAIVLALSDWRFRGKTAILYSCVGLFVAVYIVRMIFMFPYKMPMDMNYNAPVIRLLKHIIN